MSHTVQIPDELYAALASYAAQQGATPDAVILAWMREIKDRQEGPAETPEQPMDMSGLIYDSANDPLAEFLGAFEADVPDLVRRHDDYLGEAYGDNHKL